MYLLVMEEYVLVKIWLNDSGSMNIQQITKLKTPQAIMVINHSLPKYSSLSILVKN